MFDTIFEGAPEGTFVEISQLPSPRNYVDKTFFPPDRRLLRSDGSDVDWYFGPALRKNRGSSKGDVYGSKVVWADIDNIAVPTPCFPASIVVHSGGGWHLYWVLDGWCADVDIVETANKAVGEDTNADSCWNVDRLLRVPGTINSKYGSSCELRQVRRITYATADFDTLGHLDNKARHKIRTGDSRGYKSRSERDWAVVESLVAAGARDELIYLLFELQPCGDKFRDAETNGREYLQHTIERVRAMPADGRVRVTKRIYGDIVEADGAYWIDRSRGRFKLSTFVFHPTLLLQGEKEDVFVGDVTAYGYEWKDVKLPRSAFNDRRSLDKHLTVSAWTWLGRDDDVRQLQPFLLKQLQDIGLPKAKATRVMGRHINDFVVSTQSADCDTLWSGVDGPVIFLPDGRELPEVKFVVGDLPNVALLPQVNIPEVIWPIIGWFSATPYKTLLPVPFPILNVYGTRGSGKTSLLQIMQRLFGYAKPVAYDCTTTKFVMLTLLGSSNAVPISFSEYRHSVVDRILRYVLLAYDTGHDQRGRSDQTTIDYPLCAPFTIDGEDILGDPAAKERIIAVAMHPENIAEGTPQALAYNSFLREPLEHFYLQYVQHTLLRDVSAMWAEAFAQVSEVFPQQLPARVRNNLGVVALGINSFTAFVQMEVPDLRIGLQGILDSVWSTKLGRTTTLVDEFTELIVNAIARGRGADFFHVVDEKERVVWFQLSTSFEWWRRQRRFSGLSTLDRDAIRNQLYERLSSKGGKGQYVVAPKLISGTYCFGIDMALAQEFGLDVMGEFRKTTTLVWDT